MKEEGLFITRLKERLSERHRSELILSLASEYRKSDKIYQAITILKNEISKNPEFIPGRLALGRWYIECNMIDDAKKEFYEIIKKDPNNASANRWLKRINKSIENKDEAINRLNKFLIVLKRRFSPSNQS